MTTDKPAPLTPEEERLMREWATGYLDKHAGDGEVVPAIVSNNRAWAKDTLVLLATLDAERAGAGRMRDDLVAFIHAFDAHDKDMLASVFRVARDRAMRLLAALDAEPGQPR